jgi:hypothetical protein
MFCSQCGKEISDDSKFCYSCGSEVEIKKKQNTAIYNTPKVDDIKTSPLLQNKITEPSDGKGNQTISSPLSTTNENLGQFYNKGKNISNVYKSVVTSKLVVGTIITMSGFIIFIMSFLSDNEQSGVGIFWSIIVIIIGIFFLQKWFSNKGRMIEVNNDGLIYNDSKSDKFIKWIDMEEIYQVEVSRKKSSQLLLLINPIYYLILSSSKDYEYTIVTKGYKTLTINRTIKKYKDLVKIIQNYIYDGIYYRLKKIYDENDDIQFGDFIINKRGINKKNNDIILWNDIKNIETKLGIVHINQKKKLISWGTTEESKVSNYFVVIPIINQILKGEI